MESSSEPKAVDGSTSAELHEGSGDDPPDPIPSANVKVGSICLHTIKIHLHVTKN